MQGGRLRQMHRPRHRFGPNKKLAAYLMFWLLKRGSGHVVMMMMMMMIMIMSMIMMIAIRAI
jgi:hypothetical protein